MPQACNLARPWRAAQPYIGGCASLSPSEVTPVVKVALLGRNFTHTVRKLFGNVQDPEWPKQNCVETQSCIASHGHSEKGAAPQKIPRWINTRSFVTLTPESVLHRDILESFHSCGRFQQPSITLVRVSRRLIPAQERRTVLPLSP